MVRREIKNFELCIGEEKYPATVPCSVRSALSASDTKLPEGTSSVAFECDIYADEAALKMKNFYLRIRGIASPASVYLADELLIRLDGVTPVYNIDISGHVSKGNNRLSIRFDSCEVGAIDFVGLSSPLELLRFSYAIIDSVALEQKHEEGAVTLSISTSLIGDASSVRAVATLVSSSGQIYYAGLTKGQGSILISDPLYWWPKNQGVQNLYRLTVNLYGDTDIEDTAELRIGLRTAESDENGKIKINGISLLPMGSVFIPDGDPDFTTSDRRVEACVTSASMAGFCALLLPMGSPAPSDKLYELCDVHGIMIIEERGPLSPSDALSLSARAHHPSLCLIDLVDSDDKSSDLDRIISAAPGIGVRFTEEKERYKGFPSLPSMKTLRAVIPEGERNLFSRSIEAIAEEGAIRDMLLSVAERYPYPGDLDHFAYASALASAHKVGDTVRNCRLSGGKEGRPLFYRLRDTEMAISASAIDHRGRWKPLQYYSSRHFAPVALYASSDGGSIEFSVSSERRTPLICSLEYRVANAENLTILRDSIPCEIAPMTQRTIHIADLSEQLSGHESEYYIEYYLKEGSAPISRSTLLLLPEKHFDFKKPKMKTVITGQDRRFAITLSADCFVKDLEIDFDGVDVVLDDNYIDLTSEAPVKIGFTVIGGIETSYHLKEVLRLRSVCDLK